MTRRSAARRPWSLRAASLLVVAGLALTACQSAGAPVNSHTVRPSSPVSSGTPGVAKTTAPGNGESSSPATPPTNGTGAKVKSPKRKGYSIRYGPNRTARVALTFDDCPRSLAEEKEVLQGATDLGIGLMLFPTGSCIHSKTFDPKFARKLGHYVFNHSNTHPLLTRLSYSGVLSQLGPPGVQSSYGRPPFGGWNSTVARAYAAKGMRMWVWSVDTNDWKGHSEAAVVKYVIRTARAGDTVLMHMQWNGFSVDALRKMQAGLAKRGLEVCRNSGTPTPVRSPDVYC